MIFKIHLITALIVFLLMSPSISHADMIDYPQIKLQALNKSTARTVTLEGKVGQTIEYGSLFIKIQACRKSEPLDKPEDAAFLQIWEVPIGKDKSEWALSGWMFSSSPAVSAMDHAVYDVWVLECFDANAKVEKPAAKVIVNDVELDDTVEDIITNTNDDVESNEGTEEVIETDDTATPEQTPTPQNTPEEEASIDAPTPQTDIIRAEPFDQLTDDTITFE